MIDCPGIVPPNKSDTDEELLLRGVVRIENVEHPAQYIDAVLKRCEPKHIQRTYDLKSYSDATGFLEVLSRKGGRLLKGGEPDLDSCAKMVINDFLRGKIPWFTPPPLLEGQQETHGVEGREGRLGEMGRKRKREDTVEAAVEGNADQREGWEAAEEEFEDLGKEHGGPDGGIALEESRSDENQSDNSSGLSDEDESQNADTMSPDECSDASAEGDDAQVVEEVHIAHFHYIQEWPSP